MKAKPTAKQKAWRAKFAARYGGGRKRAKARASPTRGKTMARRKGTRRRSGVSGLFGGSVVRQALAGAGAASIAGVVIGENPLYRAVIGYFAGGVPGAATAYILPNIKFGGISIPGLTSSASATTNYGTGGY